MNLFVLKTWLQTRFAKDEQGANLVEYILLVALIALAVIAAVVFTLRRTVEQVFMPMAMILRTVPLVAMTPLIALIFGRGLMAVAA